MATSPNPGYAWKLYENTGTPGTPTWTLITGVRDINIPLTLDEMDDSSRDSAFKKFLAGMADIGLTFQIRYRTESTVHNGLITKVLARTAFEIAVMDQAIATSGAEGWRIPVQLFSHTLNLPLADNSLVDFTAKCAYLDDSGEVDPSWYEVA